MEEILWLYEQGTMRGSCNYGQLAFLINMIKLDWRSEWLCEIQSFCASTSMFDKH